MAEENQPGIGVNFPPLLLAVGVGAIGAWLWQQSRYIYLMALLRNKIVLHRSSHILIYSSRKEDLLHEVQNRVDSN